MVATVSSCACVEETQLNIILSTFIDILNRRFTITSSMIPKSFTGRHVPSTAEREETKMLQGVDRKESVSGVVGALIQYLAEKNRLPKLSDLPSTQL